MPTTSFPGHIHRQLGWYVYVYRDPRDDEVFYVGKGKGNRVFDHLRDITEDEKRLRIREIKNAGCQPDIKILIHGLQKEDTALQVEAAVIDLLNIDKLTNAVRGFRSKSFGIMSVEQVISNYQALAAAIQHKVCLIRIRQLFRYDMSPQELYDATRGIWNIRPERHNPTYAFAVFDGVVQEVYRIAQWFPAGTTYYSTREEMNEPFDDADAERWEFVGQLAETGVRKRYRFKSVKGYLGRNSQSAVLYVNC